MNRFRIPFLVLLIVWLFGLEPSIFSRLNPPSAAVAQVDEQSAEILKKIPFFAKTDMKRMKVSITVNNVDGLNLNGVSPGGINLGGYVYPKGVSFDGIGDLLRIYPKDPITINGIKICGHLGQHAQTLEIFEIKLCDDSEINGVKIPGGSKVTFIPHKSRVTQDWFNISCINPGGKMEYRGVIFKKGEKLLTLSKTYRPEDPDSRESECGVNVWDREMIETLKKSGMIK